MFQCLHTGVLVADKCAQAWKYPVLLAKLRPVAACRLQVEQLLPLFLP